MANKVLKQNALRPVLASAPTGAFGTIYGDTGLSKLRFHNGSSFVEIADFGQLGSDTSGSSGATLVKGDNKAYSNISGLTTYTVQDFLDRINSALGAAAGNTFSDSLFRIYDNGDNTKLLAFEVSAIATGTTRTITAPNANVDLGQVNTSIQQDGSRAFTADQSMGNFKLTNLAAGTNAADATRKDQQILRDGSQAFTADQSIGNFKLTNLADGTNASDAVNKGQLDAALNGLDWKPSVRVATVAAGTLASSFENGDTVDGITLSTGDRILIKDQASPAENGIYVVAVSGAPSRALDMDNWLEVPGAAVFVEVGTVNSDKGFVCTSDAGGTLGTTAITFVQFSSASSYVSGNGITISGQTISVRHDGQGLDFSSQDLVLELDGGTLSKSASGLKVADLGISNAQISASAAIAYSKLALTNSIVNADIAAAAAIAYSKLNLSNSIVNADINAAAAIAYSKLALTNSIVNADIAAAAAIAYSKLNLSNSIVNADINTSAAIDATKIHDGSVTNTEFGYIGGLTSDAQTQLNARVVGPASATDEALVRFDSTTGKLVQNSSSNLSDSGSLTIADTLKRGDNSLTNVLEEEYIHGASLTASTTAVLSSLTFDSKVHKSLIIEYRARNGNNGRTGRIMVAANNVDGVASSSVDLFHEELDVGGDLNLSWSAALNGDNVEISYTTLSGTYTANLDVKRFKA